MGLNRKATKRQIALADLISVEGPDPYPWLKARFRLLIKNISPGSPSAKAHEAVTLAMWLTPYEQPRLRTVDFKVEGGGVLKLTIGGGDEEFDFTAQYDLEENDDLSDGEDET